MAHGDCEAYEVRPSKDGLYPGLLLIMDAIGVRESLIALAQRLADQGMVVLVPNVFYRSKALPAFDYPERDVFTKEEFMGIITEARPMMAELTPDRMIEDAKYYIDHLKSISSGALGVVGYCMGGAHAVRVAAMYPHDIGCVLSFHAGNLAKDDDKKSPHMYLGKIQAPLYFGHADHDTSMPLPMIKTLNAELANHKKDYVSEIYAGAGHGFTQTDLPVYNAEASERSEREIINLMKRL